MPNLLSPHPTVRSAGPQLVINFGAAHVAGALIVRSAGRTTVARYAREELDPDPEGDSDWSARAGGALARLVRAQHWRGQATILLPGHLTLVKRVRMPAVGEAGRENTLLFAAQQNLPDALENLTWDGVVLFDDGADLDLLLGTARTSVVESVVGAVTHTGLKVGHLRPPGLPPPGPWTEPEASGVWVNIGARSTLLYFRWPDGWWMRRIGTAGNSVTRLLARALDADFGTAQRLKHPRVGEAGDPGLAALRRGACREFAELLAAEIRRTALTYGCCGGAERPAQIWIAGGGSRLSGLAPVLSEIIDRPVLEAGTPPDVLVAAGVADADRPGLSDLLAAVAIPAGESDESRAVSVSAGPASWPDLLPWRMKLALSVAKRRRAALVAAALVAAAPFPVAWGFVQRIATLAKEEIRVESELAPRHRATAVERALAARLEVGRREMAAWDRLDDQTGSWPRFLNGLEAAMAEVEGAWLERLAPADQSPSREAKGSTAPRRLKLAGRVREPEADPNRDADVGASVLLPRLMAALARLPEVASVTGERFDRRPGDELRFECVLNLKADTLL